MHAKLEEAKSLLAVEISREPLWSPLAEYYELCQRGLRDRAHQVVRRFCEPARHWPFEERKGFSLWLMARMGWVSEQRGRSRFRSQYRTGVTNRLAPFSVVEAVVRPTLVEWAHSEPTHPEPRFWLALYDGSSGEHLREALRLDPTYGPACAAKVELTLAAVEYAQHELPSGYLDDPAKDLNELCEAEALVAYVDDVPMRTSMYERIGELRTAAENWIQLRDQLKSLDWATRSSIWRERCR